MALHRCPCCHRRFDPGTSESLPFCSPRCRQVDLGRWLDERYSLPTLAAEEEAEEGDDSIGDRPDDV